MGKRAAGTARVAVAMLAVASARIAACGQAGRIAV